MASFLSGRVIFWIFVGLAVCGGLLAAPVILDQFFGSFSAKAERAAPVIFITGLGLLILGIYAGNLVLDIIGACLIGLILLGIWAAHY
ncbi:MAG: hypothetical protein ACRDNZ_21220 [Streptosporangiaceae bacterium]